VANLRVRDLHAPIMASKADWLAGTTWIGFTPTSGDLNSRAECQSTIQKQFGKGYVIEYITEQFSLPNPGFEKDATYLAEREAHMEQAGRFIAVHKLRHSSRSLEEILGPEEFRRLQDMWAQGGKRWRWSVAFPIIETYRILGQPKAKDVLGDQGYRRLFAHSSATLRALQPVERAALEDLELEPGVASSAWIAIEDEFKNADAYPLTPYGVRDMNRDLPNSALEGITEERRAKVRKRAAWLADRFVILRSNSGTLHCDDCGFDPRTPFPAGGIKPRSLLDVHHKHPLEEGVRYTTVADLALLCPTCHRIEHGRMKLALKAAARENGDEY
jgi:5-methylcytosine-specific restriction enzyme A